MFEDWITDETENVLLVEPNFPIPTKSRNHKNFLPIGLLKIASLLREKGINVNLVRQGFDETNYNPIDFDLIIITSIFTYWAPQVKDAVNFYKKRFPNVPILVGGIYATLMPEQCKDYTNCDEVIIGQIKEAELIKPAYDLVDVDYQIIHTTRGCIRKCHACGVYDIEPEWCCKKSIKDEIIMRKIIFYDNNILANEYIENILEELIELKKSRKISYIESQCGFDGRILVDKPYLGEMLKKAGFKNPKIAWDGSFKDNEFIKEQIDILTNGGYQAKEISIFMLYNHELSYEELERKRVACFEFGVQITDCRFRPLDSIKDGYNPAKRNGQTSKDYFIHPNWTDKEIRQFRRNVRRHNICIRHDVDYHSSLMERKKIPQEIAKRCRKLSYEEVDKKIIPDVWTPKLFHSMENHKESLVEDTCHL